MNIKVLCGGAAALLGAAAVLAPTTASSADDPAVPAGSRLVASGPASAVDVSDTGTVVVLDTVPNTAGTVVRQLWDRRTGTTTRVTAYRKGPGGVEEPQLSGDGGDVYWFQGRGTATPKLRHFSVATGTTTTRRALPPGTVEAVVSRNEQAVVYQVYLDGRSTIYRLDLATGRTEKVADGELHSVGISRTGSYVVYVRSFDVDSHAVELYSSRTRTTTNVAYTSMAGQSDPVVSSDGNKVLYADPSGAETIERWERGVGSTALSTSGDNFDPSMSDDGLVAAFRQDTVASELRQDLVVATGFPAPVMTVADGSAHGTHVASPELSANGRFVAYIRSDSTDPTTNGVYLWGPNPRP